MKIYEVEYTRVSLAPLRGRLFSLDSDFRCRIKTDCGVYVITADRGFITDMRSGGKIVDWLIDHTGNQRLSICWLVHDICFHPETLSFLRANDLLDCMLEWASVPKWKRVLVIESIEAFGYDHHTSEWEQVKAPYTANRNKYTFRHVDK